MIIGWKDGIRLFGIAIVAVCAVFVCTFFLNYYLDVINLGESVTEAQRPLFEAQIMTAKLVIAITGGFLCAIALFLLFFYIGLFISGKEKILGALKAMGYGEGRLSLHFWVFGLSVLIGAAAGHAGGYAMAPIIYNMLNAGLLDVSVTYHPTLTLFLVVLPFVVFSGAAVLFAYLKLRVSAARLLSGAPKEKRNPKPRKEKEERPFLRELLFRTPAAHKPLMFFIALAGFCFSAMVQMGWAMAPLSSPEMAAIILTIGIVLSVTTFLLAMTSLARGNARTVALMKACGYRFTEYGNAVFGGFRPFAYLGFGIGTAYQYGLLRLMVDVVFKELEISEYSFSVPVFFVTLAVFAVLYEGATLYFNYRIGKENVRKFIEE